MDHTKKAYDWYVQKKEGKWESVEKDNPKNHYWNDCITKTRFSISKEKYRAVLSEGYKLIKQYTRENKILEIEDILYRKERVFTNDASLFPILPFLRTEPFPPKETILPYRICDFLLLRTAILYCLRYKEMSKLPEEDRRKSTEAIRIHGMTWKAGIDDDGLTVPPFPELDKIDQFLLNLESREETDPSISELQIDLVKGGMVKIKQYYLETDNLPEIRGASRLLDRVNEEQMKKHICDRHIRECLIYAGGGKMLGIFPKGCGEQVCKDIEKEVEKWTVSAQSNFGYMECKMGSLNNE